MQVSRNAFRSKMPAEPTLKVIANGVLTRDNAYGIVVIVNAFKLHVLVHLQIALS